MVKQLEVLAIIPARGGSKGIPGKNIKNFAGFPLIAYSIAAAKQSKYVTRTIVSTDDEKIAAVAREWGAETPFLRPAEFATDHSLDLPVFRHALQWLKDHEGYVPDIVLQLRPTSPVRPLHLVDEAVQILLDHPEADSVRGVVPSNENPYKMWKIDPVSGAMSGLIPIDGLAEPYNAPRQILPPTYWQTGHIDAIRPERTFMAGDLMSGKVIFPIMIDPAFTVDIDTLADWIRYESLVYNGKLEMVTPEKKQHRGIPKKTNLLVMDFDGVMTDDRVYVNEFGQEMVACSRSDGMGIGLLKKAGIKIVVISSEENPVVARRCEKLGIEVHHGVSEKAKVLADFLEQNSINPDTAVYMGNDINDIDCFSLVHCAVVPADANKMAKSNADIILSHNGGFGAVRELCEMILGGK
ncbi:acylneuraminate cytidylyltransferase [Flexilinea flocculi]|jgi:YrbI family 3-deoxy-D-manno-octulosonate 8-phosphate phosphatase|uniref:N-acylneuraminate cytidylyltransferase n=1 Tax=Flexilinea flocculi TaxID=1678840 RepID=A0A0S7BIW3_9CHLR|nr:acylneuraminate cytidylyltransferase [Flexilinea flocculi]NMB94051.1 acylneuraminate cytidylyltransferase [Flexilinea flocculi]GAP40284.1 3-deoxy-D-manno-octulosonate 8-phosphate phosphatase, YrbI family [Flexilinea flocculi]